MNSRDLINRLLLSDGEFDRVGLFDHFWPETPGLWVEQGYPTRTIYKAGREVVEPENPSRRFDFDMHPSGGWFNTEAIPGAAEVIEETDEWLVRRNGSGAALKWWKHKSGTPEHIDFRMTSREIWQRDYRPHLAKEAQLSRLDGVSWKTDRSLEQDRAAREAGRAAGKWTFYGHMFIWEIMRQSLGDITMYENLLLDPGWIKDFNRVYTDFFKAHFRLLFDEMGLPDGIWIYEDLGYRNGLFASPQVLQNLIFPYFIELVEFFHAFDLPVVFHSCGDITQALPLIVEAGFDALNPMERKAGCEPFDFAEQYGDHLAFVGGFDVRVLETNDRHEIKREIVNYIEGMKARNARLIFHTDHSVTPLVTYDSYRYALDVCRQHAMY